MAANKARLAAIALWAAALGLAAALLMPRPALAGMPPVVPLAAVGASPAPAAERAADGDGDRLDLAGRLFGKPAPAPAARSSAATPPPSAAPAPAPLPSNANIHFLGVANVEGVRKIVFSDSATQVSFAISPGERYAGWTCVSIGSSEAILSREGINYRVVLK